MSFPCKTPIGHRKVEGRDINPATGDEMLSHSPASTVRVFGWEPPKSTEPILAGHKRKEVNILLYAPLKLGIVEDDLLVLNGVEYEVVGDPADPNNNPWFQPGLVTVSLHKVVG